MTVGFWLILAMPAFKLAAVIRLRDHLVTRLPVTVLLFNYGMFPLVKSGSTSSEVFPSYPK